MANLVSATVANNRTLVAPHPTQTRSVTTVISDPTGRTDGVVTTMEVPVQVEHGPGSVVELPADEVARLQAAGFLLEAGGVYHDRGTPWEMPKGGVG